MTLFILLFNLINYQLKNFTESQKQASSIAAQVAVTYKNMKPNILTTRQAIKAGSYFDLNLDDIVVGTPDESLKKCQNQVG